ncbi:MAG: phenylalanine--tRNA ligase subunit beta [Actinomycetota bacterium]|nr:phenylalanine--tRNA ligase subunit beta [Actinomycetota bacterium]
MRAPLSWIREFAPIEAAPADIADALNQLGLEVEAIDEPGRDINGVVVARILAIVPHPDADKIRLADVDYGDGRLRVVCGAPNIEPGMVVPFARVGAVLPGDFKIEKRKIRGVVSEGMLCSGRELGLSDDHAGILELDANTALGTDVREALGLDDIVFDLSITPNRPDAMGVIGVARELAAHFKVPLLAEEHEPDPKVATIEGATVVVEAPDRCPRFVAMVARVTTGPSPAWMQRRLTLAGMRPISNVVDVTNYVMLERCRPLHAFDLGRLRGRGVIVRLARHGETMTTLDGVERSFTAADLLVCDGEGRPQGIAGIMGGLESEVADDTTEVLLESAHFEATGIAKTAKRLGLRSEASARFERGIDPNSAGTGAQRAMELFAEVAAAVVAPGAIDAYPEPVEPRRITVRTARVNAVLGTEITPDATRDLLAPLGIAADGAGDTFDAIAPTWRPDLEREIDIVEEVGRRLGLDNIARTVPSNPEKIGGLTSQQRERRAIADVLVGAGYDEAYTLPLLAPADLTRAGMPVERYIEVENPLRAEESILRPSLSIGLLRAVAYNAAHGEPDVALFEIGTVFAPPAPGATLPEEHAHVAAARSGLVRRMPHEADRPVTVHDLIAVVEAVAEELRLADWTIEPAEVPGLNPARSGAVFVDGNPAGAVGEVAAAVIASAELPAPVSIIELDLDVLLSAARRSRTSEPVSRFPAATIDLAFVVSDTVPARAVQDTLAAASGPLLDRVHLFDIFRADTLGSGRVSLAFSLRFRALDRTLTDDEVAGLRQGAIDAVRAEHQAELRA